MDIEKRIDEILGKMTLKQKLGQFNMNGFNGEDSPSDIIKSHKEYQFGAYQMSYLFKTFVRGGTHLPCGVSRNRTVAEVGKWIHEIQEGAMNETGIPVFIAIDQEGGIEDSEIIRRKATVFPIQMGLCATGSVQDTYLAAKYAAREALALGVNFFYGPVVDVLMNINNDEIGYRAFAGEADTVAEFGAAYIKGCQEENVVACAKHFCGSGDGRIDAHNELEVMKHLSRERMEAIELKPFKAAIDAGVDTVMISHRVFPAFQTRHEPASMSSEIMVDLLRKELGFEGVILTDDMSMFAISNNYGIPQAVARSIEAGADMALIKVESVRQKIFDELEKSHKEGRLPMSRIDESVRRILRLKFKRGYFDHQPFDEKKVTEIHGNPEHQKACVEISRRATVLLKKGKAVTETPKPEDEVLVVVPRIHPIVKANDPDLSHEMLANEVKKLHPNVISAIVEEFPTSYQAYELDVLAERASKIIFGFLGKDPGGGALAKTEQSEDATTQIELFKKLSKKGVPIAAVTCGSPYIIPLIDEAADSIVMTFGLTRENLQSAAEVIFNQSKERGKLPVTITEEYKKDYGL